MFTNLFWFKMLPLLLLVLLSTLSYTQAKPCTQDWECQLRHGQSLCVYSECICRLGHWFDLSTSRCIIDNRFENGYQKWSPFPLGPLGRTVVSLFIVVILLVGLFLYLKVRRTRSTKTGSSFSESFHDQNSSTRSLHY